MHGDRPPVVHRDPHSDKRDRENSHRRTILTAKTHQQEQRRDGVQNQTLHAHSVHHRDKGIRTRKRADKAAIEHRRTVKCKSENRDRDHHSVRSSNLPSARHSRGTGQHNSQANGKQH